MSTSERKSGWLMRIARSAVMIGALVIGCAGIGALVGDYWLVEATSGMPRHAASSLFSARASQESECAAAVVPADIVALTAAILESPIRDFPSAVRDAFRCADARSRDRLFVIVRDAAEHGDRIAARITDALAQDACRALAILAGAPVEHAPQVIGCASAITDTIRVAPRADIVARSSIARLAQLAAVLESDMATDAVRAAFCDAVEAAPNLPDAFEVHILELVEMHCVVPSPSPSMALDGGTRDGGVRDGGHVTE